MTSSLARAMPRPAARQRLLAGLVLCLAACAQTPPSTSLALPEGRSLAVLEKQGAAAGPVLVFQSGLGDGRAPWAPVWDRLPPGQSAWAYDRPGYGGSPSVAWGRRDPCTAARELHQALQAAGVKPPYVLVGHSLGGLYQAAFAKLYPGEAAALLLLEPTHPTHWASMQRETPALAAVVSALRATTFSPAMRAEFDAQADCMDELRARPAVPVPARLLARRHYQGAEAGAFEAMSRRLQADWTGWLPWLTRREVDGTGHYLQRDRPDVVVEEALQLVAAAAALPPAHDK